MSSNYQIGDVATFFYTTMTQAGAVAEASGDFAVSWFENESGTPVVTGLTEFFTLGSIAGLNYAQLTLSTANGFEAGKDYHIVVTTGTVNGGAESWVGRVIGRFTVGRPTGLVATEVIPELTHYCDGVTSRSIISLNANFAGTLALEPDIGNATISTVNSALLTGAASVTGTSLGTDKSQRQALYTVAALSVAGTYTSTVSVTTTDSQTLVSTGTIVVT